MHALDSIFLKIYTMSYYNVILILLAFSLFITTLYTIVKHKNVFAVLLALWLATVLLETLFLRTQGNFQTDWRLFGSYVDALTVSGNRELLRSNFMNAVLFYPAGFFIAVLAKNESKPIFIFFISFAAALILSSAIELLQFRLSLGNAQIDDTFHNVIGSVIGTSVFILFKYIYKKKQKP